MTYIPHEQVCRDYGLRAASVLLYLQESLASGQSPTRAQIASSLGVSVSTIARAHCRAKDLIVALKEERYCIVINPLSRDTKDSVLPKPKRVDSDTLTQRVKTDTPKSQKAAKAPQTRASLLEYVESDTQAESPHKPSPNLPIERVKSDTFSQSKESIQGTFCAAKPANSEQESAKNPHSMYYLESRISCTCSGDSKSMSDSRFIINNINSEKNFEKGENVESVEKESGAKEKQTKTKRKKKEYPSKEILLALAKEEYGFESQEFLDIFGDFIDHRAEHKHGALTLLAAKRILKKLAGFEKEGYSAIESLDTSIVKNYSDVYCPYLSKAQNAQKHAQVVQNTQNTMNKDALLELLNRSEKIEQWLQSKGFGILNVLRGEEVPFRGRNGERICYMKNFRYNLYKPAITLFYLEGVNVECYRAEAQPKLLGGYNERQ